VERSVADRRQDHSGVPVSVGILAVIAIVFFAFWVMPSFFNGERPVSVSIGIPPEARSDIDAMTRLPPRAALSKTGLPRQTGELLTGNTRRRRSTSINRAALATRAP